MNKILNDRQDLAAIGCDKPVVIYSRNGLELEVTNILGELVVHLVVDGADVMSTNRNEHLSAIDAVDQCPQDARVFIGGLGFGLVLLYLAYSKKSREVIICEIDQRVIDKFSKSVSDYLSANYPDFCFKIMKGDAYEEIGRHGKFDWVYLDLTEGLTEKMKRLVQVALTDNGIFTNYKEIVS